MQYRQVTYKLRVQRGPGKPDLVSARPFKEVKSQRVYTDDEKPTLVEFDEHCRVDIPSLLKLGAIVEYREPKKSVPLGATAAHQAAKKEVKSDGQVSHEPK